MTCEGLGKEAAKELGIKELGEGPWQTLGTSRKHPGESGRKPGRNQVRNVFVRKPDNGPQGKENERE